MQQAMNTLEALLVVSLISFLAVLVLPRFDSWFAWGLASVLALLAGTRAGGFDFDEYELMISAVHSLAIEEWQSALFFAKEPLFLLVIRAVGLFTEDSRWVYVAVAAISVATKVQATAAMKGYRTAFIALYAVLLAPGLEFAAIRAGMAIGFLLLALASVSRWSIGYAFAAILSHYSMTVAFLGRAFVEYPRTMLIMLALVVMALPIFLPYVQEDPRYVFYFDNPGTILSLSLPLATMVVSICLYEIGRPNSIRSGLVGGAAIAASLFCATFALLFAIPFVSIAYRVMEIAWVLMLSQWIAFTAASEPQRSIHLKYFLKQFGGGVLICTTVLANVLRDTWSVMSDLPL